MVARYLLGVDIGTNGSKGVLTDRDGTVVAHHAREHRVMTPRPGWCEQDADEAWWGGLRQIIGQLLAQSGVDARDVAGVGISGMCPNVLPVDEEGRPLYSGMLYSDNRASRQIQEITAQMGEATIHRLAGRGLSPDSVGAKVAWLRENEPQVFARMRMVHTVTSYVVWKLTGVSAIDYTVAPRFSPMFDVQALGWDREGCAAVGITAEQLPTAQWATAVAGQVTERAAGETGLAAGTPVITGTCDGTAEAVSVGTVERGEASLLYGSTMALIVFAAEGVSHPRLFVSPSPIPGIYKASLAMSASGALTRWFRDQFGQMELAAQNAIGIDAYQLLGDQADTVPPGSEGLLVLPYFAGERAPIYDSRARGIIIGLTLSHTRRHVYRALLEGVGFGLRHGMEDLAEAGVEITRIVATGGGTKSRVWTQIIGDVIGRDQEIVASPYGAPLGDAFLAGLGIGLFHDVSPLRGSWVQATGVVRHDPARTRVYDAYFKVYRGLYGKLRESMHALAELSQVAVD